MQTSTKIALAVAFAAMGIGYLQVAGARVADGSTLSVAGAQQNASTMRMASPRAILPFIAPEQR